MASLVAFYIKVLAPLGIVKVVDQPNFVGFGKGSDGEPEFEIFRDDNVNSPSQHQALHFAFIADTRHAVREFHAAGIREGMTSNGEPGLREHYTPTYYAAFMEDPLGNGIEAVCQKREE